MASRDICVQTVDEDAQHNPCPECSGRVTTNCREMVCGDCRLILEDERVDLGPEWREFEDDWKSTGYGVAEHGRTARQRNRRDYRMEARWVRPAARCGQANTAFPATASESTGANRWTAERNLVAGLTEIRRIVGALGLSKSVPNQASQLFPVAQDDDLLQGRAIKAIVSGYLYAVGRLNEHPRPFEDIAAVSKISAERVKRGYSMLNREFGLPVPPASPEQ